MYKVNKAKFIIYTTVVILLLKYGVTLIVFISKTLWHAFISKFYFYMAKYENNWISCAVEKKKPIKHC